MKILIFFLGIILFPFPAVAGEFVERDEGTYVVLDQNRAPTDMFYRLSIRNGKWVAEGKKPGENWANISCDSGCEYRVSTESEIQSYFPPDWIANSQIGCIQNKAHAFCRYTANQDATYEGYVMIMLVTGHPIPVFVRRVPS